MGKQYSEIPDKLKQFIEDQKIFFVGTATRTLKCDDDGAACGRDERITLTKGSEVSCDLCHENPLFDD